MTSELSPPTSRTGRVAGFTPAGRGFAFQPRRPRIREINSPGSVSPLGAERRNATAVAQNRNSISDPQDFGYEMGDVHNAATPRLELWLRWCGSELSTSSGGQGRRRLIHDQRSSAPELMTLEDLDDLLHAKRVAFEGRAHVDVAELDSGKLRPRSRRSSFRQSMPPHLRPRWPAQEQVFRDAEFGNDAQFLVDHSDPEVEGIPWVLGPYLRAFLEVFALESDIDAGEDLHQRAFSRSVLSDQGVDLSIAQIEIDANPAPRYFPKRLVTLSNFSVVFACHRLPAGSGSRGLGKTWRRESVIDALPGSRRCDG